MIHFAMTPLHASVWQEGLGFAFAGWFQLVTAGIALAGWGNKRFYRIVAVANVTFIAVWLVSRTVGLPFGETPGVAEAVGAIDAVCVVLQGGVVLVAIRMILGSEERPHRHLAPALAAVAALGLATAVITSPSAADHNHGSQLTGVDALDAEVDKTRCDRGFNDAAYWKEADTVGTDTRWGDNPPALAGTPTSADGHSHGAAISGSATTTTTPDPLGGRGSVGLDRLVSVTGLAATSEIEAANMITALSNATQQDYDAWLRWLRTSGTLSHAHATAPAPSTSGDPTAQPTVSGHGSHAGPQSWVAMTDQVDCDRLARELALARDTALSYPTLQDALDAGYVLDTPYLPGIAAHYIKKDILDDSFDITQPEMLLYDGNAPGAHIVGLSYQIQLAGGNEPTQGFSGPNDHPHRHVGLCYSTSNGSVIGDGATTPADCLARGGTKGDGSRGWMSHAWVVPGCESPWGVFSAANPVLDDELLKSSGTDDGGCAGSGVRTRYGMGAPGAARPSEAAGPAGG